MKTHNGGLWARLEKWEIDQRGAAFPFSARLARENGWTAAFTAEVIREYKRFLYLSAVAGHPVSPSEAVDQAWHLHMVYTRSYQDELCGKILGFPLHHEPTTGGAAESAKFANWYARTLESYRLHFGEAPPPHLWPAPEVHAGRHSQPRRVDVSRYWLLPKPRLPRLPEKLRNALNFKRFISLRPRRKWSAPALTAPVFAALLPACGGVLSSVNVFTWRGPDFLWFYSFAILVALTVSWLLRRREIRRLDAAGVPGEPLDDLETALLSGGPPRAVLTAATRLACSGGLFCRKKRLFAATTPPADAGPVELDIYERVRQAGAKGLKFKDLRVDPEILRPALHRLAAQGLRPLPEERSAAALRAAVPVVILGVVGFVKWCGGLLLGKPVILLFFLTLFAMMAGAGIASLPFLTPRGAALLKQLRAAPPADDPSHFPLGVALLGPAALAGVPEFKEFHSAMRSAPQAAQSGDAASSSGCGGGGSSGCGSSGGCGGGGCGGCGGGD